MNEPMYGVELEPGVITFTTVSHGEAAILAKLDQTLAELKAATALLDATYKALTGE